MPPRTASFENSVRNLCGAVETSLEKINLRLGRGKCNKQLDKQFGLSQGYRAKPRELKMAIGLAFEEYLELKRTAAKNSDSAIGRAFAGRDLLDDAGAGGEPCAKLRLRPPTRSCRGKSGGIAFSGKCRCAAAGDKKVSENL